jgi:ABC-2 type transport system ATP-binding protein
LLTTPYLDEAERCQRVALMERGRILALDRPAALRASFRGVLVEILAEPRREARRILASLAGVTDIEVFGERLHVHLEASPAETAAREAERLGAALGEQGIAVALARPAAPILEDVFIARIRGTRSREAASGGMEA